MAMLLNGRTAAHNTLYSGCSCHNTKQVRRRAKKSIKAKAKAATSREAASEKTDRS